MEEDKAIVKADEVIACEAREIPRLIPVEEIARAFRIPPELLGKPVEEVIECEAVVRGEKVYTRCADLFKASWSHDKDGWFGNSMTEGRRRR